MGQDGLRVVALAAMLGAAGAPAGCAYVTAQPVRPGDKINGIRVYDVKPLLVVTGENVTLQMVPNYNRAYALRFGAFLAKNHFQAAMTNGVLTSVNANLDSTDFIKVLTALIDKLPGAESLAEPGAPKAGGGIKDRFQVYEIVFDDDGNLVGLRPLLTTPNMLHVKTASAGGGGGGTVIVPQLDPGSGATGGVTPGPVPG